MTGLFDRLRKFHRRPRPSVPEKFTFPLTRLDKASLLFIGVVFALFIIGRGDPAPSADSDQYYHMAVARKILEKRTIPKWDDWEYAPAGRPHLYPPALHLVTVALSVRPENVQRAYRVLQKLGYPAALFALWWFARWLSGDKAAFLALLVFSIDMAFVVTMTRAVPAALVTGLMPVTLACFLTKRFKTTAALLTLSLYTHLGTPLLLAAGLLLFSLLYRGYLRFLAGVVLVSGILYLPWLVRVVEARSWLTLPVESIGEASGRTLYGYVRGAVLAILWTHAINPVLFVLWIWGLVRFRHPAAPFVRCVLAGFLPLFVFYGGRYWMHTTPLWALVAGSALTGLLGEPAKLRRAGVLALLTLVPLPMFFFPRPSMAFAFVWTRGGGATALRYAFVGHRGDDDFPRLARFISDNTAPDEIVHVDRSKFYLGDRIVAATGRRVDTGGWMHEVQNREMIERVNRYRDIDTDCLFVFERRGPPEDLAFDRTVEIGRFTVAVRGKTAPLEDQRHPPEDGPSE